MDQYKLLRHSLKILYTALETVSILYLSEHTQHTQKIYKYSVRNYER